MPAAAQSFDFSIDLPLRNEWKNVERLRTSVASQLTAVLGEGPTGDAVSLVAAELAENAIKYCHWDDTATTLRVRIWSEDGHALVSVENPVVPGQGCPAALREAIDYIRRYPTAEDAYRAKLLTIAATPQAGRSGLGLVRLAYEARCRLRAELDADRLRVVADLDIPPRAA